MLKYAKIINKKTKEVSVAFGINHPSDYTEIDVEKSWYGNWYIAGYCPVKPAPTYEEIDKMREDYRKEHIDTKTIARMRKQANHTWTEEDEQAYLALDAEVTAYIEEHFPYPV